MQRNWSWRHLILKTLPKYEKKRFPQASKVVNASILETVLFGRKTSKWYPFQTSKISIVSDLSIWQKFPDLVVNLKISADFAFSFWAMEPKQNPESVKFLGKGNLQKRKWSQQILLQRNVKSFNFEKLAKIWEKKRFPQASKVVNARILETVLFGRKTSKWYPF